MSPTLATLLTLAGVFFLMRWEARHGEARSSALWLPFLWLVIAGSRFVSQWMNLGRGGGLDLENVSGGSPIDAIYFLTLITLAAFVLRRRGVLAGEVWHYNKLLIALVVYSFASIAWSEFPFVASKRWIKTLGHPLMALIILTEPNPAAAFRSVLRRCAFVLLPVSVLFIKYLPEYGRGFDAWTGEAFNNGVGLTKNDLGYLCMVSGILFTWCLMTPSRSGDSQVRRINILINVLMLVTVFWLLQMSNSKTSLAALLVGIGTLLAFGTPFVSRRFFGTFFVAAAALVLVLESSFDLYASIVTMLGRDPTLTDRTVVWADVIGMQNRPIFGYGFESFWLGDRLDQLWAKWWWRPTQAHNGYIETYLNLGLFGLALLAAVLLSTLRRISHQLKTDFDLARLRMALLFAIILFNYTEAGFKAVHFVWTIFYVIAMEMPRRSLPSDQQSRAPD